MSARSTDSEIGVRRSLAHMVLLLIAFCFAFFVFERCREHDIGRYTASNYGILKTVFEVNLQLEVSVRAHTQLHKHCAGAADFALQALLNLNFFPCAARHSV